MEKRIYEYTVGEGFELRDDEFLYEISYNQTPKEYLPTREYLEEERAIQRVQLIIYQKTEARMEKERARKKEDDRCERIKDPLYIWDD